MFHKSHMELMKCHRVICQFLEPVLYTILVIY